MKTFKTFLAEGTTDMFNPATFKLSALLTMYENAGYNFIRGERETFKASKYAGYKNRKHSYYFLCENNETDDTSVGYYITQMFLELNEAGLCLEPSGRPMDEGTKDEMKKKFESL